MNKPNLIVMVVLLLMFIALGSITIYLKHLINTEKEVDTPTYYLDLDEVTDTLICIYVIDQNNTEIALIDTRFGEYPLQVQTQMRNTLITQPGDKSLYDITVKYNVILDSKLKQHGLR